MARRSPATAAAAPTWSASTCMSAWAVSMAPSSRTWMATACRMPARPASRAGPSTWTRTATACSTQASAAPSPMWTATTASATWPCSSRTPWQKPGRQAGCRPRRPRWPPRSSWRRTSTPAAAARSSAQVSISTAPCTSRPTRPPPGTSSGASTGTRPNWSRTSKVVATVRRPRG